MARSPSASEGGGPAARARRLDGKHTIFGRVSAGMGVVKRLGSVQCDRNDRPVQEVKILRATVDDHGITW